MAPPNGSSEHTASRPGVVGPPARAKSKLTLTRVEGGVYMSTADCSAVQFHLQSALRRSTEQENCSAAPVTCAGNNSRRSDKFFFLESLKETLMERGEGRNETISHN